MKRILKLRGEFIINAILSIIIATVSVTVVDTIVNLFNKGAEYNYIEAAETERINYIIDQYKQGDINEYELLKTVNKWNYKYLNIYLVNNSGEVLASREKGIKNIELDKVNEKTVKELDGKNTFEICGIIKIDDEKEVVYYSTYYASDFKTVVYILVIAVILFIILTHGKIAYIGEINKGVTSIAKGDLKKRIRVKYKNELSELAKSINSMATYLEEDDDKKREFITNISHDLRTPLTTMLGYLNMIEESKYQNEEELDKYIAVINRKGRYLKTLIDDFFTYSKLNSNDLKIRYSNVECKLFLQQIIEEEKINFMRKNLELKLQLIENEAYANIESELMARAIYNLLSNALKYSQEKTEVKVIMAEENYQGKLYISISVVNTPKEKMCNENTEKLFERLYKREEGRNSKGSGLGLTITKEIMKLNNGFIKVQVLENDDVEFKLVFHKAAKDS